MREASTRLAMVRYVTKAFATRMPNATSEPMTKRRERKGGLSRVSVSPRSGSGPLRLCSGIPPVLERDFDSKGMDRRVYSRRVDRRALILPLAYDLSGPFVKKS